MTELNFEFAVSIIKETFIGNLQQTPLMYVLCKLCWNDNTTDKYVHISNLPPVLHAFLYLNPCQSVSSTLSSILFVSSLSLCLFPPSPLSPCHFLVTMSPDFSLSLFLTLFLSLCILTFSLHYIVSPLLTPQSHP